VLPENDEHLESERGIIPTKDGDYFSATFLSKLKSEKLPNSRAGIYKMANRLGWPSINVPGKGAKDGVKYFSVPKEYLQVDSSDIEIKVANSAIDAINKSNANYPTEPIKPLVSGSGIHSGGVTDEHFYQQVKHQESIYIESYLEVRGAAGAGQLTPTDQVIIKLAVNAADWRNYVGLDHRHIKVVAVHGDSMKPALSHGDQVLVDTACTSFIDNDIYAIQQGDLTRFKRIKLRLDGSIEVKSDNEKDGFKLETYTAMEAAEFQLIGRVIPFKFGRFDL